MTAEQLLIDVVKIASPWLGISGGIGSLIWKLSPFIKEAVGLYAKFTVSSEKQADALKEIAKGVQIAVSDIHLVKTQLPNVCAHPDRRATDRGGKA